MGLLQWGRNLSVAEGFHNAFQLAFCQSFNGAATFRLRKAEPIRRPRRRPAASMGPQPFGCGRLKGHAAAWTQCAASMGPQPFGCGRRLLTRLRPQGRDRFNGAATFRLRKGPRRGSTRRRRPSFNGAATFRLRKAAGQAAHELILPLQWGRNLSVAEGRFKDYRAHSIPRFNGAATFRLRKGQRRPPACRRRHAASMGPQPFGCGRPP